MRDFLILIKVLLILWDSESRRNPSLQSSRGRRSAMDAMCVTVRLSFRTHTRTETRICYIHSQIHSHSHPHIQSLIHSHTLTYTLIHMFQCPYTNFIKIPARPSLQDTAASRKIYFDEKIDEKMKFLATHLRLKRHKLLCKATNTEVSLWMPIDLEIHRGKDLRVYLLDVSRVFPPTLPLKPKNCEMVFSEKGIHFQVCRACVRVCVAIFFGGFIISVTIVICFFCANDLFVQPFRPEYHLR